MSNFRQKKIRSSHRLSCHTPVEHALQCYQLMQVPKAAIILRRDSFKYIYRSKNYK
jgi:hypothetical protein